MSLSTEIGMRVSRSCLSQQLLPFKVSRSSVPLLDHSHKGWKKCESYSTLQRRMFLSAFRGTSSDYLSCRISSCVTRTPRKSVWCFATERPRYRDGYSTIREGILLNEHEGVEKGQKRRLVMYSKPGCCLCDGLKEKLHLVFMMGGENDLSNTELEDFGRFESEDSTVAREKHTWSKILVVRDITTRDDWEKAYQYEIPVLVRLEADNSEEVLPRFSPRLSVEQLQKKLAAAMTFGN